ncbi:MAG: leucine-rich repeat domain-containing protein, partial [Treponema sp.]|nr:leucine-rich repeat domain-containing protein [Treponema sp.]
TVPVTIKNLKITGGFPRFGSSAGGIYIWNTPTTLENCVITGNKTYGIGSPTDFCAGVLLAAPATSFTLKGKNIIKDNFKVGEDGIPYPANLYVGNSTGKIKISGNITGSEIGINVPYSGTSVPTAAAPKVFTEGYGYGVRNTSLPGAIFTAENGYAITRIESGGNAGEAAFAVSSGGMYSYEDFTFGFAAKESAEAGAADVTQIFPGEARTVYIMPASLTRKESDGSDTDLYYNSTDKKLYLASDHSIKACGDNALEITAALYNGGYKVCDMTTEACDGGRTLEIPSQSLPGTYVLKVNYTYLGVTKEVNISLDCTTDGVAYGLAQIEALPSSGGSVTLTGTLTAADLTALNTAIKDRYDYSFRVDLDLSGVTELTEIPDEAFRDNDALRTVVLPEGITSIGEMAFYDCIALTTINLPDGLTEIGDSAFDACFNLTGVTIPDTITSIGGSAFEQCKLTSVVLPEGLTTVGNGAFGHMNTLQTITIPSTLTIIPMECFKFSHITTVNIPEGVEKIYYWAFWGCSELISINIPSTIDYIHAQAFDKNKKLEAINVAETNTVYKSIDGVVYKYNDDGSLSFAHYPNGKGTSYVIPADANVTSIETSFCYWQNENNDIVELTIPVSVTNIKSEAFKSCNNLTTLNYSGTMAQWDAITKASNWQGGSSTSSYRLAATVVHCSDGNVSLE